MKNFLMFATIIGLLYIAHWAWIVLYALQTHITKW